MKFKLTLASLLLCGTFTIFSACSVSDSTPDEAVPEEPPITLPEEPNEPDETPVPTPTVTPTPAATPTPSPSPTPTPEPTESTKKYILVLYEGVNIRKGASTSYASIGKLEKETCLAYISTENGWHKTYYNNSVAYVSASKEYTKIISMEKSDEKTENVIHEATKLIGTEYVYGAVRFHDGKGKLLSGFNDKKFDCSSLVQYVFYKGANKILDVNTRTQVVQGKSVKKSELKRGDCIYFTNDSRYYLSGIERVGHVALYLGDDYILHTASDYCKIEKISAKRQSYYIEARRFI